MLLPAKAIFVLLMALIIIAIIWLHHARALADRIPARRMLPAFHALHAALGRAAETGHAIHLSPGAGTVASRVSMGETVVGLLAAERVSREAALKGAPIVVSSGDAVAHLSLRGIVHQAYQYAGRAHDYDAACIQFLAHQNETAYATGVMTLYSREQLEASQLLGSFRQDFLLFGEEGARRGVSQVLGTTSVNALPLMLLTTPSTLIGEELFAAEAYLSDAAAPQARLMSHDLLRTVVVLLIVGGFVYHLIQQMQPQLGLPALPGI